MQQAAKKAKYDWTATWAPLVCYCAEEGSACFGALFLVCRELCTMATRSKLAYVTARIEQLTDPLVPPCWWPRDDLKVGWYGIWRVDRMYGLKKAQPCLPASCQSNKLPGFGISFPESLRPLIDYVETNWVALSMAMDSRTACYVPGPQLPAPFAWEGVTLRAIYFDQQGCQSWLVASRDEQHVVLAARGYVRDAQTWTPENVVMVESSIARFFQRWRLDNKLHNLSRWTKGVFDDPPDDPVTAEYLGAHEQLKTWRQLKAELEGNKPVNNPYLSVKLGKSRARHNKRSSSQRGQHRLVIVLGAAASLPAVRLDRAGRRRARALAAAALVLRLECALRALEPQVWIAKATGPVGDAPEAAVARRGILFNHDAVHHGGRGVAVLVEPKQHLGLGHAQHRRDHWHFRDVDMRDGFVSGQVRRQRTALHPGMCLDSGERQAALWIRHYDSAEQIAQLG